MKAFIIGGGTSLINFDFDRLKDKDVIAINSAILNVPFAKYFITVDYTFLYKIDLKKFSKFKAHKYFVADLHFPFMTDIDGEIRDLRLRHPYDLSLFDTVIKAHSHKGIGYNFDDFRTGLNSGFCGMQLAIALGYRKIYLLGMDFAITGDKTHYHDQYKLLRNKAFARKLEKKLIVYRRHFTDAIKQLKLERPDIEIISCSESSPLNGYVRYVPLNEI